MKQQVVYREAQVQDIPALLGLEDMCFASDKLSKRQFRHWVTAKHGIFIVATIYATAQTSKHNQDIKQQNISTETVVAYGLVITRKGTSLARLYSLAVNPNSRGLGIAKGLLDVLETRSVLRQKLFLRLEVSTQNTEAISLYKRLGYKTFGHYSDYYEDHNDALRMQKAIYQQASQKRMQAYPYYQQTTPFTCGSAALMMAMANIDSAGKEQQGFLTQSQEFAIWRQATTIFMTSGHGGTHPLGLAIAAISRGFSAKVYVNQPVPLFLAGVRDPAKKKVLAKVEQDLLLQAKLLNTEIVYADFTPADIRAALHEGKAVLCLISSYQFDGFKGPHWVTVTHIDDEFLYFHDPDEGPAEGPAEGPSQGPNEGYNDNNQHKYSPDQPNNADRQHIPVSLAKFDRYTCYGKAKLRTAVVIEKAESA